jgi:hypothetical protein
MLISCDCSRVFLETCVLLIRCNKHAPISFVSSYYGARNWVTQRGEAWGIIDRSALGCCGGTGRCLWTGTPRSSNHDTSCSASRSSAGIGFPLICVSSGLTVTYRESWGVRVLMTIVIRTTVFWDVPTFQKDLLPRPSGYSKRPIPTLNFNVISVYLRCRLECNENIKTNL